MASQTSSPKFHFVDRKGNEIVEPYEWMKAWLHILLPIETWRTITIFLNEAPLEVLLRTNKGAEVISADWPAHVGPGFHMLTITVGDTQYRSRIKVKSSKLSDNQYLELLEDLQNRLPTSIIMSLKRMGAFGSAQIVETTSLTKAQQLEKLKRAVYGDIEMPGLVQVLTALSNKCHDALISTIQEVPLHKSRRPVLTNMAGMLVRGIHPEAQLPETVMNEVVESTFDTHENRMVKTYTNAVLRRIKVLARTLPPELYTPELELLGALYTDLISAYRRAEFLRPVAVLTHGITKPTMVLLKNPSYKAAWSGYLNFFRALTVELDDPALDSPLNKLDYLYQRWAVLIVIDAVMDVCEQRGFRAARTQLLTVDDTGLFFTALAPGVEIARLTHSSNNIQVSVRPERTYSQNADHFKSLSFNQIPDLAIEITGSTLSQIVLFDPKYKIEQSKDLSAGRPRKEDIDKMHAYRDAIRDRNGNRVVQFAGIIYPGPDHSFRDDIFALCGMPGDSHRLRNAVRQIISTALTSCDSSLEVSAPHKHSDH